jgi:NTE family protein
MKYDLVFEGGGAKGMVFVGACEEFFGRGHTFDRLLGTSAGAITAILLAAGYTPKEMLEALVEREGGKSVFTGFMGPPPPFTDEEIATSATQRLLDGVDFTFVPNILEKSLHEKLIKALAASGTFRHVLALVERGGWFAAGRFVSWLSTKLDSGPWKNEGTREFSGMTLEQFFVATGVELSVVASDTTDESILVLNHRTAPDCPIVWAVRMSMSIPLVWDEVIWQANWGKYLGRDLAGHAIVDGGLLSNFPIELFISDAPQVTKLMGPKKDNPVLGLLIDEKLPVTLTKGIFVRFNIKPGELQTVQRLRRLVDTATGAHDKMVIDEYNHLVARLPAQGYGTTEFDMSDERRDALVAAGRLAMAGYLDERSSSAGSPEKFSKGVAAHESAADRIATAILR